MLSVGMLGLIQNVMESLQICGDPLLKTKRDMSCGFFHSVNV